MNILNSKKSIVRVLLLLITAFVFNCQNDPEIQKPVITRDELSGAIIASDLSVYNSGQSGRFSRTFLKYYLGTLDPIVFLPENLRAAFREHYLAYQEKTKNYSHDEIIDELVHDGTFSRLQGEEVKRGHKDLISLLAEQPDVHRLNNWFQEREQTIIQNSTLSFEEREAVINHETLIKAAVELKLEEYQLNRTVVHPREKQSEDCTFWSVLACWVGTLSGGSGLGNSVGSSVALAGGLGGNAITGAGLVGGAIGLALGALQATVTCQCSVNKNVCQAPLTVSFPYNCYVHGTPLLCEAFAYGNIRPTQFTFDFRYNNNLNNLLYSNFTANNYMWLPGDYVTSNVTSVAARVLVSCPTNPGVQLFSDWVGWFYLADLGKPFFNITGPSNFTVADAAYSSKSYWLAGPIYSTQQHTIQWELIPSGYPNYSATGTILSGTNGYNLVVKWNAKAGFANLKCTVTGNCATVVQYYTIHIR